MPPVESGETPKYDLPSPVNETGGESAGNQNEKNISSPETAKNIKVPKSSSSKTPIADFQLNDFSASQPTSTRTTSTTGNPLVADDNDLIEKEWVAKAKKIIEENREDPYNQSKEITMYKADYMKKRYNKVIKASD